MDKVVRHLEQRGATFKRLRTSHAFHSRMMEPMLKDFAEYLQQFRFDRASMPIYSTVTGRRLTDAEAEIC